MFLLLLGGDRNFSFQLLNDFNSYLDRGYTYQDIKNEIFTSFYNKTRFRFSYFSKPKNYSNNCNLVKSNVKYYHKELKLLNDPPVIERNIDNGTMVSRVSEYFLEPIASYTIQDFIQYFYKTMPVDLQSQSPNRLTGILKYKIESYGIDKLLFMTDIYAQNCKEKATVFCLSKWDDYSMEADDYINQLKSMLSDDNPYYVPRQRRIF